MIYLQLLLFSAGKVSFLCHFDCFSVYLQWVRKRPTPSTLGSLCRWSVEESWCMRCCRQLLSSQALRGPCTPIAHSKKNIICAGEDQACNKQIWFFFFLPISWPSTKLRVQLWENYTGKLFSVVSRILLFSFKEKFHILALARIIKEIWTFPRSLKVFGY